MPSTEALLFRLLVSIPLPSITVLVTYLVIYTVKKETKLPLAADSTTDITIPIDGDPTLKKFANIYEITLDKNIKWDGSALSDAGSNGDGTDANWADNAGLVQLFHFTPPSEESGWEA